MCLDDVETLHATSLQTQCDWTTCGRQPDVETRRAPSLPRPITSHLSVQTQNFASLRRDIDCTDAKFCVSATHRIATRRQLFRFFASLFSGSYTSFSLFRHQISCLDTSSNFASGEPVNQPHINCRILLTNCRIFLLFVYYIRGGLF